MKERILFFLILLGSFGLQAQLVSPDEFLPHKLGDHFTPYHLLVDYFKHVDANSEQFTLQEYGRTNENRPLIYGIISAPENMEKVEEIRKNNLRRTGLLEGTPDKSSPAIVWLSFGVHGNEAGASESSIATIYDLANPKNKEIQAWLKDVIVIVDPCINPDGYSRYTHWNRNATNIVPDPNPAGREHQEPWPGGRVNHYLFDLNRDWAWQTQVESQQRMVIYHQWMPHIHVDFHEMGHNDPYYFAPAAQPYHEYISKWQADFQQDIGKNHAKHFDDNHWAYFSHEIFDLFYPSYGDTYPTFHGAIGMTHEQAGHSMAGRAIQTDNGDTLTLYDRIAHHKMTALSTIEISAKNANKLTNAFEEYFTRSSTDPKGKYKSFVVKKSNGKDKVAALCQMLDRNHIRYGKVGRDRSMKGYDYATGKQHTVSVSASDLLISAHQPLGVLAQVLLEPEPSLPDSLTYDITAWALPFAYGLEAYAFTEKMTPSGEYRFDKISLPENKNPYAYLLPWTSLEDAKFLGQVQSQGLVLRYGTEPFSVDGKNFERGTLMILKSDNRKFQGDLDGLVRNMAKESNRNIHAATTGLVATGNDFGSSKFRLVQQPKIGVFSGEKIDANSFGQVWQLLDQDLQFGFTVLNPSAISSDRISAYNVLVMPEGAYGLDSAALVILVDWVRKGGRLIALGSAVKNLAGKKSFALKKKAVKKNTKNRKSSTPQPYAGRERRFISNYNPGSVFKLQLDKTHPLAFGLDGRYYSLKTNSMNYGWLKNGWNVAYTNDNPLVMGFVGHKLKYKMNNTLIHGVQEMGRGSVVYMVDNPLFRSFWYSGEVLFVNALFFR